MLRAPHIESSHQLNDDPITGQGAFLNGADRWLGGRIYCSVSLGLQFWDRKRGAPQLQGRRPVGRSASVVPATSSFSCPF